MWIPALSHPRPAAAGEAGLSLRQRARAELDRILAEHQPEPLDGAAQAELRTILESAAQESGG
jgi:trimethylamine:corrinoid methyltransferase-like protein